MSARPSGRAGTSTMIATVILPVRPRRLLARAVSNRRLLVDLGGLVARGRCVALDRLLDDRVLLRDRDGLRGDRPDIGGRCRIDRGRNVSVRGNGTRDRRG